MKYIKVHDDNGNIYVNAKEISSLKEAEDGTTIMMRNGRIVYCVEDIEEVVERCMDAE